MSAEFVCADILILQLYEGSDTEMDDDQGSEVEQEDEDGQASE
jgi:hypothetical protein